jgi:hypothetical protein
MVEEQRKKWYAHNCTNGDNLNGDISNLKPIEERLEMAKKIVEKTTGDMTGF